MPLTDGLNGVLRKSSIYNPQRFAGLSLPVEALLLKPLDPKGWDLIRFNRLLLETAYPQLQVR